MNYPVIVHQIELWPIDRLTPFDHNPRTHSDRQIEQIVASIREFGFVNPILVGADGVIVAGHARLAAARRIGMLQVPVIVLGHLSAPQRRALVIADNRLALNAGWDEEMLQVELAALQEQEFDLDLVGFDDQELARLLAQPDAADGLTDEDAVPAVPEIATCCPGDFWTLGPHKLLVGDATHQDAAVQLMGGETADLILTDPPYGVDYTGCTEERLKIQGDNLSPDEFQRFLSATFQSYRKIVKPSASLYICHSSSRQREFQDALEANGFEIRCQIIWAKNTFAWGFGRYKFQHEPLFYVHVAGQSDPWYGDKSQSTLWQENKPVANRLHPTMKPVELIERALLNSSRPGDLVVDLFGGSGSTLIGCERRGRRARLMEIDPHYADCIVQRWQQYTGKTAVLEGDSRTFESLSRQRREVAA
jgi:DNA modification methylase